MTEVFDVSDARQRAEGLDAAVRVLSRGQLVVLPTDTVYGVACDPYSQSAVEKLLWAKGRWKDLPLTVMVGSRHTVEALTNFLTEDARRLMEAFWPGALTVVVDARRDLRWGVEPAGGALSVRVPDHPVAVELLQATGPLAVSSANRAGAEPAISAEDAQTQLGTRVAVLLDDGPASSPLPSSVVDVRGEVPVLLRVGTISEAALRAVCPDLAASVPSTHP